MNNTKANCLQNAQILKFAHSGLTSAGINRKTVLYSLKGPLESSQSKETAKEEQKFRTQNHE